MTEKELEREIKKKGDEFRWRNNIQIFNIAAVRKWGMLVASKVKMSGIEK